MTWQNIAGAALLLAVFIGIMAAFAWQVGWKASLSVFVGSVLVSGLVMLGLDLLLS